jgi:murein DD-endopeptidase MepM/ murein hydrolase activator NlpD
LDGLRKGLDKMLKMATRVAVIFVITLCALTTICNQTGWAVSGECFRITYEVKKGDTLKSISHQYGVDDELLAAMNNLDLGAELFLGQQINIPRNPEKICKIQSGDTIWGIAKRYQVSCDSIVSYNNIYHPNKLQVGQEIRIPLGNLEEELFYPENRGKLKLASRGIESFILPVIGIVSSNYGWRRDGFHHGIDIAASLGTPIKAAKPGRVVSSCWLPIYGKTVILEHNNGVKTLYGHASELLVKRGQVVNKGETIAKVGSTGRSTGPHLHFELYIKGKTVNPARYLTGLQNN